MQEELREFLCSEQGLRGESPGQERASNDSFLPPYMQLSATAEPSTDEEHEEEDAVDWRGGAQGAEVSGELGITGKPSAAALRNLLLSPIKRFEQHLLLVFGAQHLCPQRPCMLP